MRRVSTVFGLLVSLSACSSPGESPSNGSSGGTASNVGGTGGAGVGGTTGVTGGTGGSQAGGSSGASGGAAGASNCTPVTGTTPASGTPGVWEPMLSWPKESQPISGDSLVADPARPGDFYFFYEEYQPNGQPRHVLKSTDFGNTWEQIEQTPVVGNPWGVAIDPNPCRDPNTPPTMYTPAGYGDGGVWKSTDGGVTWANLFAGITGGVVPKTGGGTTTFPPDKNGGFNDFYQIHILPDDPPNHILITYHYQAMGEPAPLGESKDGGASWEVHLLPAGDSHYVYGTDASNWLVISGEGSNGGIYRTTTAGRVGDEISLDAWTQVDALEHSHGSFTPFFDAASGALYFGGKTNVKVTQDAGATWTSVNDNGASTLFGSGTNLYAQTFYSTAVLSAPLSAPTTWTSAEGPTNEAWGGATPPYGAASAFDGQHWVLLKAEYGKCSNNCQPARSPLLANGEIWRYIEP